MPPKSTTKVQPSAKSGAGGKSRAGTAAKKGASASNGGAKKDIKEEQTKVDVPQHENDEYNMYDIDGHRIKSPEPTTRWGKFKKKCRDAWRKSFLYAKKRQFHEWNKERLERKR